MSTSSEPVLTPIKAPFFKDLVASATIFAVYFALAWLTITRHWMLEAKVSSPLIFTGACFGLTILAVFSIIAWPFRMLAGSLPLIGKHIYEWKEPEPEGLLSCALCTGMWAGSILAALGITAFPVSGIADLVLHGVLGAGTTWLLYVITAKLDGYSH